MEITSAEFVCSNTEVSKCPVSDKPEYAFIGRSNVVKSSLINMLTGKKSLAKTSSTPGKTKLINHFKINDEWFLVDLPGYGYARTSKTQREDFSRLITDYVSKRDTLVCLFVLIDSRLPAQKIDLEFIEWLGTEGIPFSLVFTKTDKLTRGELNRNLTSYKKRLLQDWESLPEIFLTSSVRKDGREEILSYIERIHSAL